MRPDRIIPLSPRRLAWLLVWMAMATFVVPALAFQPGRKGPSKAPKPPPGRNAAPPAAATSGFGKIVKYTPADEKTKDENQLGELRFKPQGKGSKTIKLCVTKDPEPVVDVPDADNYKIDLETLTEMLWKGLYCNASWNLADPTEASKPSAKKNLSRLSLTSFEVVGKIEDIQGEYVELKAKPKDGRAWPDMEGKDDTPRGGSSPNATKPKTIPTYTLKLKVVDGMTRFADSANKALSIEDFQKGQSVAAKIVYGKPEGIMIVLSDPNSSSGSEPKEEKPQRRRGVAPPPR